VADDVLRHVKDGHSLARAIVDTVREALIVLDGDRGEPFLLPDSRYLRSDHQQDGSRWQTGRRPNGLGIEAHLSCVNVGQPRKLAVCFEV
jgi:hypothetical protein